MVCVDIRKQLHMEVQVNRIIYKKNYSIINKLWVI